jgi:hypothetical protein
MHRMEVLLKLIDTYGTYAIIIGTGSLPSEFFIKLSFKFGDYGIHYLVGLSPL